VPQRVVGAAADGGDMLVLEAALERRPARLVHVVLPTAEDVFGRDSVEDAWRARHERVLEAVRDAGGEVVALGAEPSDAAYRAANRAILARAWRSSDSRASAPGERATRASSACAASSRWRATCATPSSPSAS
jgi:hypothetical protein